MVRGAIQYFLFSGMAWFAAGLIVVVIAVLDLAGIPARRATVASAGRIGLALALSLGALSGTPLPWWLAGPLIIAGIVYIGFFARKNIAAITVVLLLVAAGLAHETRYFFAAPPEIPRPSRIVVVGDSISSGEFGEEAPWPELFSRSTGIPVQNLAQPAETTSSALIYQLPRIESEPDTVVVLEIGGNDILGGTAASNFALALESLVKGTRESGAQVVMFELPLLPGRWAFGSAQRKIARRHEVPLIPKRVLARLLTDPRNVGDDALHLTQQGHLWLAGEVQRRLRLTPGEIRMRRKSANK